MAKQTEETSAPKRVLHHGLVWGNSLGRTRGPQATIRVTLAESSPRRLLGYLLGCLSTRSALCLRAEVTLPAHAKFSGYALSGFQDSLVRFAMLLERHAGLKAQSDNRPAFPLHQLLTLLQIFRLFNG
jgi:hypothetical protein